SAARSRSSPASEDWLPPKKSTVSFLRSTAGRSKGSSVASVMAAVASCEYAKHFVLTPKSLRESRHLRYSRHSFPNPRCIIAARAHETVARLTPADCPRWCLFLLVYSPSHGD